MNEELLKEREWISVKDEMPPEMEMVLCLQADGDYTVGYLYDTEENGWNTQVYGTVTHWMPLPAPPEGDT